MPQKSIVTLTRRIKNDVWGFMNYEMKKVCEWFKMPITEKPLPKKKRRRRREEATV